MRRCPKTNQAIASHTTHIAAKPVNSEHGDGDHHRDEHRQSEHHHCAADDQVRDAHLTARGLAPGARRRQVGDNRVELAVGSSGEHGLESLLELLGQQPSLAHRATEPLGYRLTICI